MGLGNVWRFPFTTAEGGGAAFLFVYLVILVLVGLPVMLAELALGRRGKLNPVGSFRRLSHGNRFWTGVGLLFIVTSLFIISWYGVLSGWVLRYVFASATGAYFDAPAAYFGSIQDGPLTLLMHAVMIVTVTVVLAAGVSRGIERVAFVMMPILAVLLIGLAVWVATLEGAGPGYAFYLRPNLREIDGAILISATGQAFFSLSLGQGAILTYASYLDERESLAENGALISLADTGVAVLAGFMIFPALAVAGLLTTEAGPGALFIGLATAFANLGDLGRVLGTLFFTALFFAAFTSAVSLLEPSIAFVQDQFGIRRRKAALLMGLIAYTGGIVAALDRGYFGVASGDGTDIIVILGGLLIAVFVGWFVAGGTEEIDRGGRLRLGRYAMWMLRYPVPVVLFALLVISAVDYVQKIRAGEALFGT